MSYLMTLQTWLAGLPLAPSWLMALAKITLILAGGWLLHGAFARSNPRWRVLVWRMVAVGVAALPLLLGLGSPLRLRLPAPSLAVSPASTGSFSEPTPLRLGETARVSPRASQAAAAQASAPPAASLPAPSSVSSAVLPPPPAPSWLALRLTAWMTHLRIHWPVALWLAGVSLMALRWAAGWRRLRRLIGEASPAPAPLIELLQRIAGDLGCRAAELRLDARVTTPLIAGWRRPVLLLPARMAGPSYDDELPAIIAHELSHLRAGDLLWSQLLHLLQALLWFHPLAWPVGRAHAAACEAVSDATAAAYVGDPGAYSRTLARVAIELAEMPPLAGGIAMARVPEIMHRLARLRRRVFAHPLARAHVRGFALGFMVLIGLLGAIRITQAQAAAKGGIDLLKVYPTPLGEGELKTPLKYQLTAEDIYEISGFSLTVGSDLQVSTGRATVGFGTTDAGATFAIVIPQQESRLKSPSLPAEESFKHLWLRFHPGLIAKLFPPATVLGPGDKSQLKLMNQITEIKVINSFYAGVRGVSHVIIPPSERLTVDADNTRGARRFFVVDRGHATAEYVSQLETQTVAAAGAKPQAASVLPGRLDDRVSRYIKDDYQRLCDTFKREYPLFARKPDVDWAKLCDKYREAATGAKTAEEFAGVLKTMLAELRDDHILIKAGKEDFVPVYGQPRPANVNPSAWAALLNPRHEAGKCIEWSKTADKIGLVVIQGWDDEALGDRFDELLEEMRDTRCLIIDVRDTQNGLRTNKADEIAGRFTDRIVKAGYREYFMGDKKPVVMTDSSLRPRGPWCYDRPTLVLIGPHTTEGTELFAASLAACPQVKTVGERSDGGYGQLSHVNMFSEVEVRMPFELYDRPDKQPLSGRGLTPDLPVAAGPGAFRGDKDPVIEAALAAARTHPVPAQPIAGESIAQIREQARAREERRPKVVRVEPADGAQGLDTQSELRIWFDQPMDPVRINLSTGENKFLDAELPRYDAGEHKFTIPLRLKPGTTYRVEVNQQVFSNTALEGFATPEGLAARSYAWTIKTRGTPQTPALRAQSGATSASLAAPPVPGADAALRALLAKVAEKRRQLKSISEVNASISLSGDKDGFSRITSFWTTFKWQGPRQCYGAFDNGQRDSLFEVGFDGRECWMRYQKIVTALPAGDVEYKNMQVCELFQPRPQNGKTAPPLDVAAQISSFGLEYQGTTTLNGRKCHLVYERQNVRTWWIDDELALPVLRAEQKAYSQSRMKYWMVFVYDRVNKPIPDAEFSYGDPAKTVVNRPEPLDADYQHRFINVIDATTGRESIRLGKVGPKGMSSSGLN